MGGAPADDAGSMLVLAVVLVLWCCGGLLALGLCWASGRGDGTIIVFPEEHDLAPAVELAG